MTDSPKTPAKGGSKSLMENLLGLLRIRVKRGVNLAVRDVRSSDPYVVIKMGKQKLKTRVIKKDVNPEWNEDLTLSVTDPSVPIKLLLEEKDRSRILDPHTKVLQWIENTKNATRPHFYEVHDVLFRAKIRFQEQRLKRASNKTDSRDRSALPSKM